MTARTQGRVRGRAARAARAGVRRWSALRCLAALAFVALATAPVLPGEVWVVNSGDATVSVIDEDQLRGDFPVPGNGLAFGLAFSTFVGAPGEFAFVSRGSDIHVVDVDSASGPLPLTPSISTVSIASELGIPVDDLRIRGLEAALTDHFVGNGSCGAPGVTVPRAYLHAAVEQFDGADWIPRYLVLDQEALAGFGTCDVVVAVGNLLLAPPPDPVDVLRVEVLGTRAGFVQRAWYTLRERSSPERLRAVLVGSTENEGAFSVAERLIRIAQAGESIPDAVQVGAPHATELAMLPRGASGLLEDLGTGETCALGGNVRSVEIAGPGRNSYGMLVAKGAPGVAGTLEIRARTDCDLRGVAQVGVDPVDVDVDGQIAWRLAYVANRESDSVTVVPENDPAFGASDVELAQPGAICSKCPVSLAVRETPQSVCRAVRLELDLLGQDVLYTWERRGCATGTQVRRWCRCDADFLDDCPPECNAACPVEPLSGDWCEWDPVDAADENDTSQNSGGSNSSTTYHVVHTDD